MAKIVAKKTSKNEAKSARHFAKEDSKPQQKRFILGIFNRYSAV